MLTAFSQLFEHVDRAVLLLTLTGEILVMNPAAQCCFVRPGNSEFADNRVTAPLIEIRELLPSLSDQLDREKQLVLEHRFESLGNLRLSFSLVNSVAELLVLLMIDPIDICINNDEQMSFNTSAKSNHQPHLPDMYNESINPTKLSYQQNDLCSDKIDSREVDQFIYNVSHDLKSPLVTMLGFADMLKEDCYEKLDEHARKYVDYIVGGAKKMESRLSAIHELSHISRNIKISNYLNFSELIDETLKVIKPLLLDRQVEIKVVSELPQILCDRARLIDLLSHLLTNAIKFTPIERIASIEISCQRVADFYQFCISDNGIGIDAKYHEKIFDLFYRVNVTKAIDGVGLGLTLVRRIVHAHGGSLRVESNKGEGVVRSFSRCRWLKGLSASNINREKYEYGGISNTVSRR